MTKQRLFAILFIFVITPFTQASMSIDKLDYMLGKFDMTVSFYADGKWQPAEPAIETTVHHVLNKAFIRMELPVLFPGTETPFQFEITFTYDRFNHEFRIVALDDLNGYLDMYSGQIVNDQLTATNFKTTTGFPDGNGGTVYGRLDLNATKNGFAIDAFTSTGEESPFTPYMKMQFHKKM